MMAAIQLAMMGQEVHILEKNEKLGKKLFITGKGRCNVTNACDLEDFFPAVKRNPKFLYSSFYSFSNQDVISFFEKAGVPLKTERGNRVFPVSDHSSDIIRALERTLKREGVLIHLKTEVTHLVLEGHTVKECLLSHGGSFQGDCILVATGGMSYPSTGSTGDGYRFAGEAGHTIIPCSPSLVPLLTKEAYISELAGLSLKNVRLSILKGKKNIFQDFGEMMFTHTGVTGPLVLSASAELDEIKAGDQLTALVDLKPALSLQMLDARLVREFTAVPNKQFKNAIASLFPSSLLPVIVSLGEIQPEKPVHSVTKEERLSFASLIKNFPFTITGRGDFSEAVITRGGVSVKEVDPQTMRSRLVDNLYFAGEVLDLDAVTGGYNLQIAWSTGYQAAQGILKALGLSGT